MKILPSLMMALAIAMICPLAHAQVPTPAAFFKLDAGIGTSAADLSGHGCNGTLQGSAGWGPGLAGASSLKLSGRRGGYVDIPKAVVDTSHSYTATACVRLDRSTGWQTFVSIDGSQVSGFFLQLRGDTGEFAMTTLSRDDPDSDTNTAGSNVDPLSGVWYHLAGVYDAEKQTLSLYVDGSLQQTVPFTTPWSAAGDTLIGRGEYAGHPTDFADATLANVRFYDTALSATQIQGIAQGDLPESERNEPRPGQVATITIEAAHPGPRISPMQHGLMTEEINHSYDGGLYAELIRNRAFEDSPDAPVHWTLVQTRGATGGMTLDNTEPLSTALPASLKLTVSSAPAGGHVGVANDGYWGIPVTPDTRYKVSFFARTAPGFAGPITVDLESSDGSKVYAHGSVGRISDGWRRYEIEIETGKIAPTADARFVIAASHPGTIWLNLISVFPPTYHNQIGGNRADLMQKLADFKPAFLRFPGGNYLEGDTIATRFDWKKTIGPLTDRPGHEGPWGYRSSDGMGLLEYLEWCEELRMEPVLAVYAGYSLNHYRNPNPERVAPGPALAPYVQDALDEIEYITGGADTQWGKVRAADGHPGPFKLEYVEVGNEDWFDGSHTYDARFAQFYDAIKAKYPSLAIIATMPVRSRTPDLVDEHYYLSPREFERDIHHYDDYPRTGPKVFVGEWASQEGDPAADFASALGDAAWMTGMERNSDVVALECYAPLLANVNPGARQWDHPNLIGYDALTSFASPSYYAQQMFVANRGDVNLPAAVDGAPRVAQSVTRDTKTGVIYIHLVNWAATPQPAHIVVGGVSHIAPAGRAIVLTSDSLTDGNSIDHPDSIVPVPSQVTGLGTDFTYTFPAHSVTVLELRAK